MISAGAASIDITPDFPVELGGYQSKRSHEKTERTRHPLTAHALILENSSHHLIIISYDLIWLSEPLCEEIKQAIKAFFTEKTADVLCCATHTHSSPQPLERASFFGQTDKRYSTFLQKQSTRLVKNALEQIQPVTVTHARNRIRWKYAVKRTKVCRRLFSLTKQVIHSPNPDHTPPQDFNLISVHNRLGERICLVVSMAAHPVFHKDTCFSPDYPGAIRNQLQARLGFNGPILFLQGFSGDIRPNYSSSTIRERLEQLINTGTLQAGFAKNIDNKLSEFTASAVQNFLSKSPSPLTHSNGNSAVLKKNSEAIHLSDSFSQPDPDNDDTFSLNINRVDVSDNLSLCTINAELFSDYAAILRNIEQETGRIIIPVGYTDGMLGYLPDKRILELQSGYEYKSWKKFGLPAPLRPEISGQIEEAVHKLFDA